MGCCCMRPVHSGDHPEPNQKYLIGLGNAGRAHADSGRYRSADVECRDGNDRKIGGMKKKPRTVLFENRE